MKNGLSQQLTILPSLYCKYVKVQINCNHTQKYCYSSYPDFSLKNKSTVAGTFNILLSMELRKILNSREWDEMTHTVPSSHLLY